MQSFSAARIAADVRCAEAACRGGRPGRPRADVAAGGRPTAAQSSYNTDAAGKSAEWTE